MSIYEQDTDPASPDARRPTPEPPPSSAPSTMQPQQPPRSSRSATTDPGVGPPTTPPPPGTYSAPMSRPMGVVVPPASGRARVDPLTPAGGRAKDSVELLLEGMAGPRPDRTKTMPQTDGEASAAYHSEHAVRAGRTAHDEERKVLVDTVRLPIGVGAEDLDVRAPLPDPTYVLPARLAPRVVVAIMAGLLVVVALFAALDRSASVKRDPVAAPAAQPPAAAPIEPSSPSVPAGPAPALAAVPQQPQAGPAEQPPAADLARPQSAPVATRPRASVQRSKPGAPDVGEFKTSF